MRPSLFISGLPSYFIGYNGNGSNIPFRSLHNRGGQQAVDDLQILRNRIVRYKLFILEISYPILATRRYAFMRNPIHQKNILAAHLLKDRHFPENTGVIHFRIALKQQMYKIPFLQVCRFIKQQSPVGCIGLLNAETDNHIPDITLFPDILVTHVRTDISGRLLGNNRITRIFLPFYQRSIFWKSNTHSHLVSTGCVYQLGDTVIIDNSMPGPYSILVISSIRSQSRLFLRPMKHIGTAEMSPIYLSQEDCRSILLIEYMIFTFIKK